LVLLHFAIPLVGPTASIQELQESLLELGEVESTESSGYYNYVLLDPRKLPDSFVEAVFYVGKGKGSRMHQHRKDAERGSEEPKHQRIRKLSDAKSGYHAIVVFSDLSEAMAFALEGLLIRAVADEQPQPAFYEMKENRDHDDFFLTNATQGHRLRVKDESALRALTLREATAVWERLASTLLIASTLYFA